MFEKGYRYVVAFIALMLLLPGIQSSGEENEMEYKEPGNDRNPAETCLITGYVNNTSGAPIPGASVRIVDSSGRDNRTGADGSGIYRIWVIPGITKITAMPFGYRGKNSTITAQGGLNPEVSFVLSLLGPELVTITGFVNSTGGATLGNTTIYITDGSSWENATWANQTTGQYRINCVNGTVIVIAIKEGYNYAVRNLNVINNQTVYLSFALTPIPIPSSLIKGYVKNEEGDPVKDIGVVTVNNTHMFSNQTATDNSGYYELGVIEDWLHLIIDEDEYFEFHDYFYVKDEETIWYNITITEKGPRTARFFGTVVDEETGDPIEGVAIKAELDEIHWTDEVKTNATGEFELFLYDGYYEVTIEADGYFGDDFKNYFNEGVQVEKDFELRQLPPMTSMITGYIRDEEGKAMDVQVVVAFDFMNEGSMMAATQNGFYQMPIWEGRFLVAAMMQGYSISVEAVIVASHSVVWVNLTMYEITSVIRGYVNDSEGNPLEGVGVNPMDDKTINFDGYETDPEGFYEIGIHPGTFAMLVGGGMDDIMEAGEYDPFVKEITVLNDSVVWINVTLYESSKTTFSSSLTFTDWEHVVREGYGNTSPNKTAESRLLFDRLIGNGDMILSEDEVDELTKIFLDGVFGDDEKRDDDDDNGNPFVKDTKNQFRLDGLPYILDENSSELKFLNYAGAWDDPATGIMEFYSEYNYSIVVADNLSHEIDINLSWKYHDESGIDEMNFYFPEDYGAIDWDDVENMSMEGGNHWIITAGYNPNKLFEEDEVIENIDYVWVHSYLNRTYNITDSSDTVGNTGEDVNFLLDITEAEEVKSVVLEYSYAGDTNVSTVTLVGTDGYYKYSITVPENESRKLEYRFIVEIESYFKLYVPHKGVKTIPIIDIIAPKALFEASPSMANVGTVVVFDASYSRDNIDIASYNFTFGDGSHLETVNSTVEHVYDQVGKYIVELVVTDGEGNTANSQLSLEIINDTIRPEVNKTIPENGARGVNPEITIIIIFSEPISPDSLEIVIEGLKFNYSYDADNNTVEIVMNGTLLWGTQYFVSINASDLIGNSLGGYLLKFTVIEKDNFDSDRDGVPDGEDAFPENPTGALDTDGDGLPDELLNASGWNGTVFTEDLDDDNDSWTDKEELLYGTDPKDVKNFPMDMDGDRIPDEEDPDIDGDGWNNTMEISAFTDPRDPDSYPKDTDGDTIPDILDNDIDGDGVPNSEDEDPYDSTVGKKEEFLGTTMMIIIAVVLVVLVGGVIVLLFLRKGSKKEKSVGMEEEESEWIAEEDEAGYGPTFEDDDADGEDGMASQGDKCIFCGIMLDQVSGGLECGKCGAGYNIDGSLMEEDEMEEFYEDDDVPEFDDSLDDDFDW